MFKAKMKVWTKIENYFLDSILKIQDCHMSN
jgi:hypothetical protein